MDTAASSGVSRNGKRRIYACTTCVTFHNFPMPPCTMVGRCGSPCDLLVLFQLKNCMNSACNVPFMILFSTWCSKMIEIMTWRGVASAKRLWPPLKNFHIMIAGHSKHLLSNEALRSEMKLILVAITAKNRLHNNFNAQRRRKLSHASAHDHLLIHMEK